MRTGRPSASPGPLIYTRFGVALKLWNWLGVTTVPFPSVLVTCQPTFSKGMDSAPDVSGCSRLIFKYHVTPPVDAQVTSVWKLPDCARAFSSPGCIRPKKSGRWSVDSSSAANAGVATNRQHHTAVAKRHRGPVAKRLTVRLRVVLS